MLGSAGGVGVEGWGWAFGAAAEEFELPALGVEVGDGEEELCGEEAVWEKMGC